MTALSTLQTQLQSILNQEGLSDDFKEAVNHGIYACNLGSVAALENWINKWRVDKPTLETFSEDDKDYFNGVYFVEEQWYKVTGMF